MPEIFLLGDSISVQYGPYLEDMLGKNFKLLRKSGLQQALKNLDIPEGANGGDSSMVFKYLECVMKTDWKPDLLALNCGLHDIKRDPQTNAIQVELDQYKKNLDAIFSIALFS